MNNSYTICLPWPDRRLAPHAKGHWRPKAHATKAARWVGCWHGKNAKLPKDPEARLIFTFHPPDNRRRDLHNMPAMMKAYIDGLADAMGVDDNKFRCLWPGHFAKVVDGGAVVIEIKGRQGICHRNLQDQARDPHGARR